MAKVWVYRVTDSGNLTRKPSKAKYNVKQGDYLFFERDGSFEVKTRPEGLFRESRFTENNPCAGPVIAQLGPKESFTFDVVKPPKHGGIIPPKVPPG